VEAGLAIQVFLLVEQADTSKLTANIQNINIFFVFIFIKKSAKNLYLYHKSFDEKIKLFLLNTSKIRKLITPKKL
jgi:hypothetical protein